MAMVFSKQRFDFVRKTTTEKLKKYSKNLKNAKKSTFFWLNVLKIRWWQKNTVNKIEENEPEKLKKLLITDYAKVKNTKQTGWQPHVSHDSYTFQAFKWIRVEVFRDNNRDFKSRTLFVGGLRRVSGCSL